MAAMYKKPASAHEFKAQYEEITRLYDYAEDLVATVESPMVGDSGRQLEIVEPLIHEIGEAADALAEEFIFIAESKRYKGAGKVSKHRIEASLRRIFAAISDYQLRVHDISKKAHGAIQNIADPIVAKIQRQVEEVVVIFLEFIQFSLQSIMG
ncbi:MAG: hypothetical protein KGJ21_07240, partial [Pseudomonadota bacterium]|nr:hypothetical protein [Pseudomonadota bacterium]